MIKITTESHISTKVTGEPLKNFSSSGAVLFMVLILTVIMYLVAGTLLMITMTEVHLADFEQRSTQAFYAAESSLVPGLSELRQDPYYRTDTSDAVRAGTNTIMFTAEFYDGTNDGNGHYLKTLDPSLYRLIIRGVGTVPGSYSSAKRAVERDVVVKPFALFAEHTITLEAGSTVNGNVHANNNVSIENKATVNGDVTASVNVKDTGTVSGVVSSKEPEIVLPEFPLNYYYPAYWYGGTEYAAQPVEHDTVQLDKDKSPPVPSIEVYSGFPTSDNPAGVFYLDSEPAAGSIIAIQVNGTLIIPQSGMVTLQGAATITPVDNFPALISAGNLNIDIVGGLEQYSASLKPCQIKGLIYVQKNLSLLGSNTSGDVIKGSILGRNIRITGNPTIQLTYDPALYSNPPPGIELLELGEWREVFD